MQHLYTICFEYDKALRYKCESLIASNYYLVMRCSRDVAGVVESSHFAPSIPSK